ncbi:MAG: tetratricopeptide repeat protein [Arachidicoccus sp.]|nr:tetratricopeptide repeat protein [Arachidicoccus sp.]
MKKYLIRAVLICIVLAYPAMSMSQQKNKKSKSDNEDMQQQMQELQKQMDNADPETKAAMEKMGLGNLTKNLQQATQNAASMKGNPEDYQTDRILDKPLSKTIPATPSSKAELVSYINQFKTTAEAALVPDIKAKVSQYLNKGRQTGYAALTFWMGKRTDAAIYLMINACASAPDDALLLNNFAAALTMSGYANKALPILNYIQKTYPNSPTLLNNIGQAYLSLGYTDKAKPFLTQALSKDKNPEAAHSLAVMAKQQGNTAECAGYAEDAIASAIAGSDEINILHEYEPEKNLADFIRPRFQKYYTDQSITKRFVPPAIPASYTQYAATWTEVETFFKNLDVTKDEANTQASELLAKYQQQRQQNVTQMRQDVTSMGNLAVSGTNTTGAGIAFLSKYHHPLQILAGIMLGDIDNPQYSTSYATRLQREKDSRQEKLIQLENSLKDIDKQISAIGKQRSTLKTGEGQPDNKLDEELEKQQCTLSVKRVNTKAAGEAEINNTYMHNTEDLLNQELKEKAFWTTIYAYPNDPTSSVYQVYAQYLVAIDAFRSLYPSFENPAVPPCENDTTTSPDITGQLQRWEADHCNLNIEIDAKLSTWHMTCTENKITLKFPNGLGGEWDSKLDPVTWASTAHSISVTAGASKEFGGKGVSGEIGAEGKLTLKLDGGLNPTDFIVSGTASAGVNGPGGIGKSVDLGNAEISLSSGFNSASIVPDMVSKFFGN